MRKTIKILWYNMLSGKHLDKMCKAASKDDKALAEAALSDYIKNKLKLELLKS